MLCIDDLKNAAEELQLLEVVDEKLLEFKKEQRDLINKAKLEYIIGAALEGPEVLDEIMTEFCENRGLDDGLVDYLDEIVAKAQEDENNSDSKESVLVKMLKVIKDRVVAEIRTRDKPYVKLLASLLRMEDHPEREAFLRGALLNPDDATRFQGFIVDGVQYMEQHRADWLMDERVEKMKMIAREAMVGMFKKLLEQRRDAAARQKAEKPSS
ncbi:hypothetical protein GUITHDRAFT_116961 [Guillardia theta CCMP2712]|uniref:Uncharacterized protein n=1 Tax=Guillardia theta (strain CCMP2712) TaxID=905079 RepID=L1IL05_GUITC|nr:hypothetical protein GUITHDRAFT_116961 [Guillardia theta CCMP2712]EKX36938.1 hypothetical protein GUITHDRAFT_116961 [Guillardia theta CCMP2712]|eukprot:XP_005823918.1 hypothetical protein GUITHDRAFT_116961 [Guillardia theta CCMP2712]